MEEGRTINNQGYKYNSYGGYEDEEGANDKEDYRYNAYQVPYSYEEEEAHKNANGY